jgi:hypothetical protein
MLLRLSRIKERAGLRDEACRSALRAVSVHADLARRFPDAPYFAIGAALCEMSAARALDRMDAPDEACPLLESALQRLATLPEAELARPQMKDAIARCERMLLAVRDAAPR